jgi:hypothetical protein
LEKLAIIYETPKHPIVHHGTHRETLSEMGWRPKRRSSEHSANYSRMEIFDLLSRSSVQGLCF